MEAEEFKVEIGKLLKANGFKKASSTWRKDTGESIAVLNIQKSQWGGGTYYINVGLYFKCLGTSSSPTENICHIQQRLPVESPVEVAATALKWFGQRQTLSAIRQLHQDGELQGMALVFKSLVEAAT